MITGKERDAETGLDYFGARYFSGAQGRFTSPDPLLNSGRPWEPQSWNRYPYTRNNPLAFTDPTGLCDYGACIASKVRCDAWRARTDAGINAAQAALASGKLSRNEANALKATLNYLGNAKDGNGVVILFGKISGAATGQLVGINQIKLDMNKIDARFVDPGAFRAGYDKTTEVGATAIHEAAHGRDLAYGIYDFSPRSDTEAHINQDLVPFRAAEVRAYGNESLVYKGLNVGESGGELWNLSWKEADRDTYRKAGVQAGADRSTQAARDTLEERRRNGQ